MQETDKKTGRCPSILTCKDFDTMIQCRLQQKMEKQYSQEV